MAETKTNIPIEIKMGNAGTNNSNLPAFKEGSIIFTKDTKKIYIDPVGETERIAVGSGEVDLSRKQDKFADVTNPGICKVTMSNSDQTYFCNNSSDSGIYFDSSIRLLQGKGIKNNDDLVNKKYVDDNSGAGKKFGTSEVFNDYENNITYKYKGVKITNITDTTDNSILTLESVAGLSAAATFNIAFRIDSDSAANLISTQFKIVSVDTVNKTITTTPKYSGPPTSIYLLYVVNSPATNTTPLYVIYSHAEGQSTTATGSCSHAEGQSTTASGSCSHAQNFNTKAGYDNQTAMGMNNTNKSDTLLEVGNGSIQTTSNAFEVYRDGHAEVQKMSTTDNSVAIKKYVDDIKAELLDAITHPYTYDETTKELTLIL